VCEYRPGGSSGAYVVEYIDRALEIPTMEGTMNRTFVEKRLEEFFPDLHLNIISIIAGVEVAVGAVSLYALFDTSPTEFALSFLLWIPAFLYVSLAWYAYMVGALVLEWLPGWSDCLYALLMGLFGFLLFTAIQRPVLWLIFWIGSCVTAYLETKHVEAMIRASQSRGRFEPTEVGNRYVRKMKDDQMGLIVATAVSVCVLALEIILRNKLISSGFGFLNCLLFAYLIKKEDDHWKNLQRLLGLHQTREPAPSPTESVKPQPETDVNSN
jgi:hypothetical protein